MRLRSFVRFIFILLFDIYVQIVEWPRVFFLRLIDYSGLIKALEQSGTTRLALVAPHPTQLLEFSMRHLVRGLIDNGYTVVVLMHDHSKAAWLQREFPQIHLAPRKLQGRDFGAWKEILLALFKSAILRRSVERLVLVNDSIYWNASTREIIRRLTETPQAWSCLFENFEYHYHAQSFLLAFDNRAINSKVFMDFWKKYKPYSSRRHSINNGEVKLSRKVGGKFGKPECVLSSEVVVRRLMMERSENFEGILMSLEINRHIFRDYGRSLDRFESNTGISPNSYGEFVSVTEINRSVEIHKIAMTVAKLMECHNPTHMVGILVNRFFGFPIKRDVCQRGSFQIADVLRLVTGYSEQECTVMAADLRAKELPISMGGLKRMLFDAGRI